MKTDYWFNKTRADPVAYILSRTLSRTEDKVTADTESRKDDLSYVNSARPDHEGNELAHTTVQIKNKARQVFAIFVKLPRLRHPTFQRIFGRAERARGRWTFAGTAA
jgi:hypothetical protein